MTDLLKRSLAPITDEAWKELDAQAVRTLKGNLSARGLVDFDGPHGWTLAAVNLGGVETDAAQPVKGVHWGRRSVLPLVEFRTPFTLGIWDLDNLSRGARNPNLDPLIQACRNSALFEEKVIYQGLKSAGITGILDAASHKAIPCSGKPEHFVASVEAAILTLQKAGVGGPYALVLGTTPYGALMTGDPKLYPPRIEVQQLLGGGIFWSPAVSGGLLLSRRGGDFEMTVGQDLAIGYAAHDKTTVELYVTESFTFRVMEPAAAVEIKIGA